MPTVQAFFRAEFILAADTRKAGRTSALLAIHLTHTMTATIFRTDCNCAVPPRPLLFAPTQTTGAIAHAIFAASNATLLRATIVSGELGPAVTLTRLTLAMPGAVVGADVNRTIASTPRLPTSTVTGSTLAMI